MSTVAKLFTSIINSRLNKFCEDNDMINDEQNGFRKLRSCIDHIYVLTSIIKNRLLQKKSTFVSFVDFSKAFESIKAPISNKIT